MTRTMNQLDPLDRAVLSESGNAQDIVLKLYGKKIGMNNAEKQLAGARMHAQAKLDSVMPADDNYQEEIGFTGTGTRTTTRMLNLSEEDKQNPERVMTLMGFDPALWDIVDLKMRRNYWDVTMKLKGEDGTEAPDKSTNHAFEVSIKVKPKLGAALSSDSLARVIQGIDFALPKGNYKYASNGLMWEVPFMDLHFGKFAWADQTGEDHYDIKIAKQRALDALRYFLGKAGDYEKILFPIGQDFFHIDNVDNSTTSGTRVDTDGRWEKIFALGLEFLVEALAELRRIAPVDVFYVPGNHDKLLSYCAVEALGLGFRNDPAVTVDTGPTARKYRQFGRNLIGFSHGKEGKRIETVMQVDAPEMWGQTDVREWHLGDLHHEEVQEVGGIVIRRLPSLTSTDGWHAEKGFTGSHKRAQAFVWDKENGLVDIQYSPTIKVRESDL